MKDAITGEPLIGATIKISELDNAITVSDIDGNYLINIKQGGRYTIEANYVGYEPSEMKEILISGAKEVVLDIILRENMNIRLNLFYQYGFDVPVGINGSNYCVTNRFYAYTDEPLVSKSNTRNYGGDITLEHYMSHGFFGQTNFSLYKSEYRGEDKVAQPTLRSWLYVQDFRW